MTWTPYNPFQPQSYPLDPGYYLATEDVPEGELLTIEAYWTSEGWMSGDPDCDEEAYQLDFISAWMPLPPPYEGEGKCSGCGCSHDLRNPCEICR